jgi:hypothetical protein
VALSRLELSLALSFLLELDFFRRERIGFSTLTVFPHPPFAPRTLMQSVGSVATSARRPHGVDHHVVLALPDLPEAGLRGGQHLVEISLRQKKSGAVSMRTPLVGSNCCDSPSERNVFASKLFGGASSNRRQLGFSVRGKHLRQHV